MTLFELIGPFLVLQAVLLERLERTSGGAVLRPRRSDYAVFGTALGWIGAPMCLITVFFALFDGDVGMIGVGAAALVAALWWASGRRRRRPEPHADDLRRLAHEVLEAVAGSGTVRARLVDPGDVAGVTWPAATVLKFDHAGWLVEAVPADSLLLGGFALRPAEPVKFDAAGRIRELVPEVDVVAGRLPRGATEARGAQLVARAGAPFDPRQLRGVVLAKDTTIRGVDVPAGSTVSAFHGVRVELAADAEVFGERIEKGARLRFGESGGLMSMFRREPAVRVSLAPKEGYRTGGERRVIALYEDGRVE